MAALPNICTGARDNDTIYVAEADVQPEIPWSSHFPLLLPAPRKFSNLSDKSRIFPIIGMAISDIVTISLHRSDHFRAIGKKVISLCGPPSRFAIALT